MKSILNSETKERTPSREPEQKTLSAKQKGELPPQRPMLVKQHQQKAKQLDELNNVTHKMAFAREGTERCFNVSADSDIAEPKSADQEDSDADDDEENPAPC